MGGVVEWVGWVDVCRVIVFVVGGLVGLGLSVVEWVVGLLFLW